MLTIFTAPKPFEGDIGRIQENAIGSWSKLHPEVQILLIGDESGIRRSSEKMGARHLGSVLTNEWGTPLVSSLFDLARQAAAFPTLCFVNTDVILLPDLLSALRAVKNQFQQFLLVGRRWDLQIREQISFHSGWQDSIEQDLRLHGTLHPPAGSDYFIYERDQFEHLPPFAIGRAGWDNWMIYSSRRDGIPVVDATESITAIHQDHDYRHLPGHQPHYRLPESKANVRIAGGAHAIFTLRDATWRLGVGGSARPVRWSEDPKRRLETAVLIRLGDSPLARLTHGAFHPVRTLTKVWGGLRGFSSRLVRSGTEKEPSPVEDV